MNPKLHRQKPNFSHLLRVVVGTFSFALYPTLARAQTSEINIDPFSNEDLVGTADIQVTKVKTSLPPKATEYKLPADVFADFYQPTILLAQTTRSVKILTPTVDTVENVAATSVILQFPVGSQVELRVNGVLVEKSLVGRTETDPAANLITQTWYGVSLKDGANVISAQLVGGDEPPVKVRVMVRGAPKKLRLSTLESRIPADGRSTATIRGQLLDENGNISDRDAIVTLITSDGEFVGVNHSSDRSKFQVEAKKGQFTATLRSSLHAQTVRIRAIANDLEAFTQLQFETALRPSLLTGFADFRLGARGTDFFSSYQNFLPADSNNKTQLDFHSAIFATGSIGQWLFTAAYNSSRNLNEDCNCDNQLFRASQFSDKSYSVYGDSSKSDVLTPSIDSVFVRLERSSGKPGVSPDYFMWGDYNTQEFARPSQQFTATTLALHGFKGNYSFGNLQITGFYGNNLPAFQRDTIAPDGTSGYYFLSQRLVVGGSENVFFELEELNRPGTVLSTTQLTRGSDYDIDYDRGTILFHAPVLATDIDSNGQVLVRHIVVTYQYGSQVSTSYIYAGRLQYNLSRMINQESWLAASYLKENLGTQNFELYGVDGLISLGKTGKIIGEYAHSTNDSDSVGMVSSEAYRFDANDTIFKKLQVHGYYSFADTGFANNATTSFVPGQTRYGAQLTGKISPATSLQLQYDHEADYGLAPQPQTTFDALFSPGSQAVPGTPVNNSLTTISAGIQQRVFSHATVDLDFIRRDSVDRSTGVPVQTDSDELQSRFSVPLAKNLTFQALNDLTVSSQSNSLYPDRTVLGMNWTAIPGVSISLGQQFYSSGQLSGQSITSLSVNGEHKLGTDTTLTARYSILGGANELTTQGAIGLNNRWMIAPGLRLNTAYEHIFGSFFSNTAAGQQFAQPFAVGQTASSIGFSGGDSYSVGLEYSDNPAFQASGRYEHRTSAGGNNNVITGGITGKLNSALTALVRYQQANSSNQNLVGLGDTITLRTGLAYRNPKNDKFNVLLRYEYRQNPSSIPETILLGSGAAAQDQTFAIETLYAASLQWEFYTKCALRNSTSYLASDLAGTSTVTLAQFRTTYHLGYNMDLVGETRWIDQGSYTETGFVLEAGYYLTANLRLSGGYVFGKVNDRDFSGVRSAGGFYGGLTLKLNELFSGFGLQKVTPPQQQESVVKPLIPGIDPAGKEKI